MKYPVLLLLVILASCRSKPDTLFLERTASETGLQFSNDIVENEQLNVLNYEYIYNGGGVGIGDFNNDSLPDIYFTGNRVANKLFMNKGQLRFEDVTRSAGVEGAGKWCKGVSIVDINQDGWMDIYVCAAVTNELLARRNLLYVNQAKSGSPVFQEKAAEYGLDDASNTQMAAFFDYDNDGDLDVYLLVNDLDGTYPNEFKPIRKDGIAPNTDKLLRNSFDSSLGHAVFSDVSKQAGILYEGYGLGLSIADINQDGWKDIYVSNDYLSNNLWYINNRDGTFTNHCASMLSHGSRNAMGNDIADINNDGLADLVEMDMMPADHYRQKMMFSNITYQTFQNTEHYGYMYQYPRNTLQLNRGIAPDSLGLPVFSDIAYFSGVAHTDWSWSPLLADADNDGFRDLLISNGLPRDMSDLDFMAYRKDAVDKTPLQEVLKQLPTLQIHNYIFKNSGNLQFEDKSTPWGWASPSYSTGMAYGDLDRDGDLDIVVNNTNMQATLMENRLMQAKTENKPHHIRIALKGPVQNLQGFGSIVHVYSGGQHQFIEHSPYRGYLSTVEPILHFGLGAAGGVDSVVVEWPGDLKTVLRGPVMDQTHFMDMRSASPDSAVFPSPNAVPLMRNLGPSVGLNVGFAEVDFIDFNIQRMIPHKLTRYGPSVAVGDINGDGLDDFIAGGSSPFYASVFTQQRNGSFLRKRIVNPKQPQLQDDAGLCLFDAEGDGDLDLYIASGGAENEPQSKPYTDHFYVNDGKGNFQELNLPITNNRASKGCIAAHDYDLDGDIDLFIGGRVIPGQYPLPASSFLYRNDSKAGQITFTDVTRTQAPELQGIGMITAACWSDADADGRMELVLTAEWGSPMIFRMQQGQLKKVTGPLDQLTGWWNSILPADPDNDGDMDYLLGNYGINGYLQPSAQDPIRAYVSDFDQNNSTDAVFTTHQRLSITDSSRVEVPLAGRDDFLREMSAMRERFPNYSSYAKATLKTLFTPEQMKSARVFSVVEFRSGWLENKGAMQFVFHAFPIEAQLAPVYGMVARDMDGDGFTDIALIGNEFSMAPSLGRYDAFHGLVLKGDGKGQWMPLSLQQSGFFLTGNGRSAAEINLPGGAGILALENIGTVKLFAYPWEQQRLIRLAPDELYVLVKDKQGWKRREEFPRGAGFLAQSGRYIYLSASTEQIEIFRAGGLSRTLKP